MKTYFIHHEGQSLGPFSIGELNQQKVSKNTPVWCEGMDGWDIAANIEELQPLFKVTPPPVSQIRHVAPPVIEPRVLEQADEQSPDSKKKNNLWIYISFVLLISCAIASFTYQQIEINSYENSIVEKADSIKELQRQLNGSNEQLDEIKSEQQMREEALQRESSQKQLDQANADLRAAKDKLEKLNETEFQNSEDKIQQVQTQQAVIQDLENKVSQLNRNLSTVAQ